MSAYGRDQRAGAQPGPLRRIPGVAAQLSDPVLLVH